MKESANKKLIQINVIRRIIISLMAKTCRVRQLSGSVGVKFVLGLFGCIKALADIISVSDNITSCYLRFFVAVQIWLSFRWKVKVKYSAGFLHQDIRSMIVAIIIDLFSIVKLFDRRSCLICLGDLMAFDLVWWWRIWLIGGLGR